MAVNKPSKTHTSFLRRLLVAYIIDSGSNSVSDIVDVSGMSRRTVQDVIKSLPELEMRIEYSGRGKARKYHITSWGAVNKEWTENNIQYICDLLSCPSS
ncbi:conserved hypothetical protein [Vibrio nigripulchritudo SOn1]|uniref:Helix-turn-helix type 11 domain-containing protein n=1 Tax=Vibrio nigripulchritudo SOn1 TaxID=1238450 RepID=A0AAV2VL61_9VIBR|nr:helix-turn-helix domain-containing protein [Vibrio nigripulchritudo]CCO45442.1 conserved hypothetical protein [Vibrio nigripulchritudo SOn1]